MTFRISNNKKVIDAITPTNSSNAMNIYNTDIQVLRQALLNPSKYFVDGFRVYNTELQYATLVSLINKSFFDSLGNPTSAGTSAGISEDGTEVVFGFPYALDGSGVEVGRVDIHDWDGQKWIQRGSLYGVTENGRFGRSVAISENGSLLIVGASKAKDSNNVETGTVNVYEWNGSAWISRGITIYGNVNASFTGYSCDISSDGNIIIVGSYGEELQSGLRTGSVDVYEWENSTYWSNKGPTFYGSVGSENMGKAVCISPDGNTIAFGAPSDVNLAGVGVGTVRVYDWNGVEWVQKGLTLYGEHVFASAGDSVSLSSDGNVVVYGSPTFNSNGVVIGRVDVFAWDGSAWVPKGDPFFGTNSYCLAGTSVDLSGDGNVMTFGSPNHRNSQGDPIGLIYIFIWSGTIWTPLDDIEGQITGAGLGFSTKLSSSGNMMAYGTGKAVNEQGQDVSSGEVLRLI